METINEYDTNTVIIHMEGNTGCSSGDYCQYCLLKDYCYPNTF